jgi:hypothetical protein
MKWKGCERLQSLPNLRYVLTFTDWTEENIKTFVMISRILVENWTSYLLNASQKQYCLNQHAQIIGMCIVIQGGIGKFPGCCCNCLGERRWEGRPRPHFHKPIISVCHVTQRCEHALILHECFFYFVFRFVCDGWQNRATCLHQVFCEAW